MIYLFLSSTLSAFLLMEFVNLFLLLKMGLIEILALRVLHDLLLNDLWGGDSVLGVGSPLGCYVRGLSLYPKFCWVPGCCMCGPPVIPGYDSDGCCHPRKPRPGNGGCCRLGALVTHPCSCGCC